MRDQERQNDALSAVYDQMGERFPEFVDRFEALAQTLNPKAMNWCDFSYIKECFVGREADWELFLEHLGVREEMLVMSGSADRLVFDVWNNFGAFNRLISRVPQVLKELKEEMSKRTVTALSSTAAGAGSDQLEFV